MSPDRVEPPFYHFIARAGVTSPAPRNRTLQLSEADRLRYQPRLLQLHQPVVVGQVLNRTICQDMMTAIAYLPDQCVDLLILDPPYNLTKTFGQAAMKQQSPADYGAWVESWLAPLQRLLTATASIYVCCDWRSSGLLQTVLAKYFQIQNRITWEREKGRAAQHNWKNCLEDIWFCTMTTDYVFNQSAVQLKRQVRAPYRDRQGSPKDWEDTGQGKFRLTAASNLWTDITIPFWSMPENTPHPTQKPEKLLAKLILASSHPGQVVFDPFLGSGTTSVVASKLDRHYVGIELDEYYACLAEKRLELAVRDRRIQGYADQVFWERNSHR